MLTCINNVLEKRLLAFSNLAAFRKMNVFGENADWLLFGSFQSLKWRLYVFICHRHAIFQPAGHLTQPAEKNETWYPTSSRIFISITGLLRLYSSFSMGFSVPNFRWKFVTFLCFLSKIYWWKQNSTILT